VALPIDAGLYRLTARFGDCGPRWQKCHTGLDFAAPVGTPVKSIADGTVASIGDGGAYGVLVKISHADDTESWYTHMPSVSSVQVREGQSVRGGQVIGAVGMTGNTTGPHLHLEVRKRGTPIDPERWLSARGVDP
jgi:murein DD-endopeptidase MepM/ murein hydrolase activator NlpD